MDAWIYRIPPKPKAGKAGGAKPPPSVLDLARRSGRFPPEPYPPAKQIDFNKANNLAGRNPAPKKPGDPLDASGSFRDDVEEALVIVNTGDTVAVKQSRSGMPLLSLTGEAGMTLEYRGSVQSLSPLASAPAVRLHDA